MLRNTNRVHGDCNLKKYATRYTTHYVISATRSFINASFELNAEKAFSIKSENIFHINKQNILYKAAMGSSLPKNSQHCRVTAHWHRWNAHCSRALMQMLPQDGTTSAEVVTLQHVHFAQQAQKIRPPTLFVLARTVGSGKLKKADTSRLTGLLGRQCHWSQCSRNWLPAVCSGREPATVCGMPAGGAVLLPDFTSKPRALLNYPTPKAKTSPGEECECAKENAEGRTPVKMYTCGADGHASCTTFSLSVEQVIGEPCP
eukprot:574173-Pleurochrysis_carterae.AAC.5